MNVKQFVVRDGGAYAALTDSGQIVEQFRHSPSQRTKWRTLDPPESFGRVAHLAAHGSRLIVINSRGQVAIQSNDGSLNKRGVFDQWAPVEIDLIETP